MSELESAINFSNTNGLETIVWDAGAVPYPLWLSLQTIHRESLRAQLPREEWDRADAITRFDDLQT